MRRRALVLIFVRAPERGRVKTRLAADVGDEAALRIYERLALQAINAACGLGDEAAVRVCYTPSGAGEVIRSWLGEARVEYRPQGKGDLGERMRGAFRDAFDDGADRVVIVGSDLPDMSPELLREALELLDRHPAVLGPALDGGYYLLGLRNPLPNVFRAIPWSTDRVLATTLARFAKAGVDPELLAPRNDVDTADDLPPEWRPVSRASRP